MLTDKVSGNLYNLQKGAKLTFRDINISTDGQLVQIDASGTNTYLTFASGTKLVLDAYPTAPGMTETGFVATRWATPLTTMASDGAIPVEIELPSGQAAPETALILPICTVSPETARNLTFRLPKYPGKCRIVEQRTNADGSITFLARFERRGITICIR